MALTSILFDLDDTLLWDRKSIQTAFRNTCNTAAEHFSLDAERLEDLVRKAAKKLYASYDTYPFVKEIGINPFEALWGTFDDEGENFQKLKSLAPHYQSAAWTQGLLAAGVDDPDFAAQLARQFAEERKKHPCVYEETFSVLEALKDNYKLLLVTNGSPSLQWTKLRLTPELEPYFEGVIISGNIGYGKPNRRMFAAALELAGAEPEEAVMVGDNLLTDIKGANEAGIRSIWINHDRVKAEEVSPTYEAGRLLDVVDLVRQL